MEAKELIGKILQAKKIEDIFEDVRKDINIPYKEIITIIHPDVCSLDRADEASTKLNQLVQEFRAGGKKFEDESGIFYSNGYTTVYNGNINKDILNWSKKNFDMLQNKAVDHLKNYIPKEIYQDEDTNCQYKERSICLSGITLPQEHVNWILSRLLEFGLMMSDGGLSHCGINPESIFIVPETHGIIVSSFYHMTAIGKRVDTINGKYKNWYPSSLFVDKIATPSIDIELSKRLAINLLGDSSGIGNKLKGKIPKEFLIFVQKNHINPLEAYREYREMLGKTFEKKFHILNL